MAGSLITGGRDADGNLVAARKFSIQKRKPQRERHAPHCAWTTAPQYWIDGRVLSQAEPAQAGRCHLRKFSILLIPALVSR
jgi:hypothetical protein